MFGSKFTMYIWIGKAAFHKSPTNKTKNNFCVELYLTVALIDPYNRRAFIIPP